MTKHYDVDAPDSVRDQLPAEVEVESASELDQQIHDMRKRTEGKCDFRVDEENNTIRTLTFIAD